MRQDQYEKLQALEEKLVDVFIEESDPHEWPGAGLKIAAMLPQTRGDRYWTKKNAAATGILVNRVTSMIGAQQGFGTTAADADAEGERQLDAEIASAEKQAMKLLDELQRGTTKRAFDRKVHGGKP